MSAESLPYAFARDHRVVVAGIADGHALLEVQETTRAESLAEARRHLGRPIRARVVDAESFAKRLESTYSSAGAAKEYRDALEADPSLEDLLQEIPPTQDLLERDDQAPVIRMVNALLSQALRDGASDVHLEAFERRSGVRFRRDGVLFDVLEPPRALHAALVSRIKIMAQLDIAEKRLPQDGRIGLDVGGRSVDVRVSTLPTGHGERVVLRLLEKDAARLDLATLGMDADTLATFADLVNQPHGLVLVTGPTGSGKTTTLYSALRRIDTARRNVMTVEDPIEYDLEGIGQTQVNARIDMTFARALRAILRQDPDVVMVGEIRDRETAETAVQASLTGHLVLATLHTNDAASAVTRLGDMGVEPFLIASSLLGVLAQRLVRCLCPACAPDEPMRDPLASPVGCDACHQSGYRGRVGVYELMRVDAELRALIHDRAAEHDLRSRATARGLRSMRLDGERWVNTRRTSMQELMRATTA
jgi:general secretion pathway protein E